MIQKLPTTLLLLFFCSACLAQTTWGTNNTRTETRNNAGASGSGVMSGFYEGDEGSGAKSNYPSGVANTDTRWHLLDVRHSSTTANFAMQFSGSFFDDQLFFRKTKGSANQSWNRIVQDINGLVALGGPVDGNTNKGRVNLQVIDKYDPDPTHNHTYHSYNLLLDQSLEMSTDAQILGPGGLVIQKFTSTASGLTGSWINFPTDKGGPCGLGSGGVGNNPWIAFATSNGEWFTNAAQNDICYRNTTGKILLGNTAGAAAMSITGNKIGIGTNNPSEMLSVNGNIVTKRLRVTQSGWSDYVFEPTYKLLPLKQVEEYITRNHHLPDVPTAKQVEEQGIDVGSSQATLLRKIEELTLYVIEQNKKLEEQQKQVGELRQEIRTLKGSSR
ncbi:MAG: hypothetical protein INR73_03015 [Williamsia sp.]|nr:hypothetical protein [Williamsia sp.]